MQFQEELVLSNVNNPKVRVLLLVGLLTLIALGAPSLVVAGDVLRYDTLGPAVLERSTADLSRYRFVDDRLPISRLALPGEVGEVLDTQRADNTTYYYRLRSGETYSETIRVDTPDKALPPLTKPDILIDKLSYYLEVRDAGVPVKRYPITMGPRPGRKVCLDRCSTPEGRYRITGVQWESNYYAAYDLSYPNAVDKARWSFYRKHQLTAQPIGGAIQIHGMGDWYEWNWNLSSNWTWGCIAMRDDDLDELLAQPVVGKGTPVTIVGSELTREDLQAIDQADRAAVARALQGALGASARCDAEWLGRYQLASGLPITCQPDARTLRALRIR